MPEKMSVCPNCGQAVYGSRVRYYDFPDESVIETDCPRCGLQERIVSISDEAPAPGVEEG